MYKHISSKGALSRRFPSGFQEGIEGDGASPNAALEVALEILRLRRMRDRQWEGIRFSDPAWDIVLGLFVAHYEAKTIARSDAVAMATVPSTTARRTISKLITAKLVTSSPDPGDRRRHYLRLERVTVRDLGSLLETVAQRSRRGDADGNEPVDGMVSLARRADGPANMPPPKAGDLTAATNAPPAFKRLRRDTDRE